MKDKKKSKFQSNIGFLVFAIISIYFVITIAVNLLKKPISICRVEEGQIINSASFTGVCVRDEEIVNADKDGYINFYVGEGDKVASGGNVYLLSSKEPNKKTDSSNETVESIVQNYTDVRDMITTFSKNFSESQYSKVNSLRYNLQSLSTEMLSAVNIHDFDVHTSDGVVVTTPKSGIVSYTYDGYEDLTAEQVDQKVLLDSTYEKHQIDPMTYIKSGQPAYKLVRDHKWQIVISLTESQAKMLENTTSVNISLQKDNLKAIADLSISRGIDGIYGILTLNDYMERYISERYIDIEILFQQVSGLKIPTSSLVQKDFYQIPIQYLVNDNQSYNNGFYREKTNENGEIVADFQTSGIYFQDQNYFYVSMDDFKFGEYIGKANSDQEDTRFRIGATKALNGVYDVNKGYTQFEIVNILNQNSDYCIVQENLKNSISLFDNIVLNGSLVKEDQIVY